MGIFIDSPYDESFRNFLRGEPGPQGNGFHLLPNGNFSLQNKNLEDVGMPKKENDCASKKFVEAYAVEKSMPNNLDLNHKRIFNLGMPIKPSDSCTKAYADSLSYDNKNNTSFLLTNGQRPMIGNLDLNNNNKITNLKNPEDGQDAVTRQYSDLQTLTKSVFTVNQFNLSTGDFIAGNNIQVMTFTPSADDFHYNYHN